MNRLKLRVVLNVEYDNYGNHTVSDFEDILRDGIEHIVDNGMISGILEAILEEHNISVNEVVEEDDDDGG